MGRYQRIAAKLKKAYRDDTLKGLKDSPKSGDHSIVASAEVPRRIYYSGDKYFNNPYWEREGVVKRYAGPPAHFPEFERTEEITLIELERALKKRGIPGMTKLYGVRIKRAGFAGNAAYINRFVAFGANGRLIWKHIGGNTLYIDGKKVSIRDIVDSGTPVMAKVQDQALAPLKEPKL